MITLLPNNADRCIFTLDWKVGGSQYITLHCDFRITFCRFFMTALKLHQYLNTQSRMFFNVRAPHVD